MKKLLPSLLFEIEYETNKNNLNQNLLLLEEKIKNIIIKINFCKDTQEAEEYFALLGQIQSILAKLVFKDEVNVSNYLLEFIKDFDRIDDEDAQRYLFNEIKAGKYS